MIALAALSLAATVGLSSPSLENSRTRGVALPPIEVVYTNLPGVKSAVPGLPGLEFEELRSFPFQRLAGSRNGNWVLAAITNADDGDRDEVLLADGALVIREGDPAPWPGAAGERFVAGDDSTIETRFAIDDRGDVAFEAKTDGPFDRDAYVVRRSGVTFEAIAAAGAATGLPEAAGTAWGGSFRSVVLARRGRVGFLGDLEGSAEERGAVALLGDAVLLREGRAPVGAVEGVRDFANDGLWVTPDGAHSLAFADLDATLATAGVALSDGVVVVREGTVLPGSGFASPVAERGIVRGALAADGRWFVIGENEDGAEWVYGGEAGRPGTVIARDGAPITGTTDERWAEGGSVVVFRMVAGDRFGNVLVGGVTDAAEFERRNVIVFDGQTVVARSGDPLDLDGNGAFDDAAVLGDLFFEACCYAAHLDDRGLLAFFADIDVEGRTRQSTGFLRLDVSRLRQVVWASSFEH